LDDFGTGYSNMRRIASLPLHIVKLDKTFATAETNDNMTIVLENTIKMIKAMNMQIVVEGIETLDLVKRFTALDCEYIQGYYYSKPIPKKDFITFIQNANETTSET
jgi:sensor c-di-GMP phosphodiesterase-like protein